MQDVLTCIMSTIYHLLSAMHNMMYAAYLLSAEQLSSYFTNDIFFNKIRYVNIVLCCKYHFIKQQDTQSISIFKSIK